VRKLLAVLSIVLGLSFVGSDALAGRKVRLMY
jgi:hypothetical protein